MSAATGSTSEVREGLVSVVGLNRNEVFYNPCQVFNRDLSLLVLKTYIEERRASHEARLAKNPNSQLGPWKGVKIIEPLGASGLRSLRYALELPEGYVQKIVVNDLDPEATKCMEVNRERNGVDANLVQPSNGDANAILHAHRFNGEMYDVIDLDPYGSVAPFLDSAVYNIKNGGLLCLTSTDMQVLGATTPEVSFYKYGGASLKRGFLHEMAVRLVLNAAQMTAAKYRRFIHPVLCLSVDFYVRLFVIVSDSPSECKLTNFLSAQVFSCGHCESFQVMPFGIPPTESKRQQKKKAFLAKRDMTENDMGEKPSEEEEEEKKDITHDEKKENKTERKLASGVVVDLDKMKEDSRLGLGPPRTAHVNYFPIKNLDGRCYNCKAHSVSVGGPFNRHPLHDMSFVNKLMANLNTLPSLKMTQRIESILTAVSEEVNEAPLYYQHPTLFQRVKARCMPLTHFKAVLMMNGYKVSHFHQQPNAIKTDAPDSVVWDVVRGWCKHHMPAEPNAILTDHDTYLEYDAEKVSQYIKDNGLFGKSNNAVALNEDTSNGAASCEEPEKKKVKKVAKFLPNPERNWGPKARAGGNNVIKVEDSNAEVAQE